MKRKSLYFTEPFHVEIHDETLAEVEPTKVLIKTLYSAISAGTEMLLYRGLVPADLAVDTTIKSLKGRFHYPLKYGYAVVGKVVECGRKVPPRWLGKTVFALHPHEDYFTARAGELLQLPENLAPLDAVFIPNLDTAVNLVMDGAPVIGENVVVFGQGIVGLLTTALLSRFPLKSLVTIDNLELRRETSLALGAQFSVDAGEADLFRRVRDWWRQQGAQPFADLIFEVSGNPRALDQAIELAGFHARIIAGSWYGTGEAALMLGGKFHRNRLRIISSQVSTIGPNYTDRWSKSRRLGVVLDTIGQIGPARFITHTFPFSRAAQAFKLIHEKPEECIHVVLTYD